ncbi:MAG: DUF2096 family protein [Bacillota bacterium]
MGHNMAYWKLLEEMTIELKKKNLVIPENIMGDLRSAKSMIKLHCTQAIGAGDVIQKAEELTANVEAYLVTEGQKVLGPEKVDSWLLRLEQANAEACVEIATENKFVTGVPRDQKWVRVEPLNNLSTERMGQIACKLNLEIKPQKDGKLVVFGQLDNIKEFIKRMTQESSAKQ